MSFEDFSNMPTEFLKTSSWLNVKALTAYFVKNKEYEKLKVISENIGIHMEAIAHAADAEAFRITLEAAKYKYHHYYGVEILLSLTYAEFLVHPMNLGWNELSYDEFMFRKKEFISIFTFFGCGDLIIGEKASEYVKLMHLFMSEDEFISIREKHNLLVSNTECNPFFQNIAYPDSIMKNINDYSTPVDVLLSRTYSSYFTEILESYSLFASKKYEKNILAKVFNPIADAYKQLASSEYKIIKDTMDYLVVSIAYGNTIKMRYEDDIDSEYNNLINAITINIQDSKMHGYIDSIVIHEIQHFVINDIFKYGSSPLPLLDMYNKFKKSKEEKEYPISLYNKFVDVRFYAEGMHTVSSKNQKIHKFAQELIDNENAFDAAARTILLHAADLLGIYDICDEYETLGDLSECLKYGSELDLFLANALVSRSTYYPHVLLHSINHERIYWKHYYPDTCADTHQHSLTIDMPIDIPTVLLENVLPAIVKDANMTESQISFLERVSYVATMGCNILSNLELYPNTSCQPICNERSQHAELIVLYAELQMAPDIDESELAPFSGMVEYWENNISPKIREYIDTYQERCEFIKLLDTQANITINRMSYNDFPDYCIEL